MRSSDWCSDVCSSDLIEYEGNNQTRYIYTILRDRTTSCDDFIFYSDRMTRLPVEEALNHVPMGPQTVTSLLVALKSEVRRVGNEGVSTCISGCSRYHEKKK